MTVPGFPCMPDVVQEGRKKCRTCSHEITTSPLLASPLVEVAPAAASGGWLNANPDFYPTLRLL